MAGNPCFGECAVLRCEHSCFQLAPCTVANGCCMSSCIFPKTRRQEVSPYLSPHQKQQLRLILFHLPSGVARNLRLILTFWRCPFLSCFLHSFFSAPLVDPTCIHCMASGSFLCRDLDLFYGEHFGWKQWMAKKLHSIYYLYSCFYLLLFFVACTKQPFEACCACAKDCSDVFGRFTTWPRDCGTAIMNCHTNCPAP